MVRTQAYRILGVDRNADRTEIKKRYRQLMHMVHPDSNAAKAAGEYPYTAQEINEAYEVICRYVTPEDDSHNRREHSNYEHSHQEHAGRHSGQWRSEAPAWDAPENPNAYAARNVYHSVEDVDGNRLGDIVIASGRYIWKPEEDFSLFLKSMLECSAKLLDEVQAEADMEVKLKFQAELAYLLAQQFIDAEGTLPLLVGEPAAHDDADIYHMSCMLEKIPARRVRLNIVPGAPLYPEKISGHRLYLKNEKGRSAGYLSFKDDRMYYIIIPMLEHRRAQIKIQVKKTDTVYTELDFWVKIVHGCEGTFAENISLQIDDLINRYRNRYKKGY